MPASVFQPSVDKFVCAVFLRTSFGGSNPGRASNGSEYLRERYNIVWYGTNPTMTFIEGLPEPELRLIMGNDTKDVNDTEVYDEIRVYDAPPFNNRIGSRQ